MNIIDLRKGKSQLGAGVLQGRFLKKIKGSSFVSVAATPPKLLPCEAEGD